MKIVALSVTLGVLLIGSLAALAVAWRSAGIEIGLFGWAVLAVGALVSIGLGAGLMWLSFLSARAGYDDRIVPDEEAHRD